MNPTMSAEIAKTVHEIRLTELEQAEAPGGKLRETNLDLIRDVKVRLTVDPIDRPVTAEADLSIGFHQ